MEHFGGWVTKNVFIRRCKNQAETLNMIQNEFKTIIINFNGGLILLIRKTFIVEGLWHVRVGEDQQDPKIFEKDLSLCHKLRFSNPWIFANWWRKPLIFQTINSVRPNNLSLKYQRFTPFHTFNMLFLFLLIALKGSKKDSDGSGLRPFWKFSCCDERSWLLSGERSLHYNKDLIDIN